MSSVICYLSEELFVFNLAKNSFNFRLSVFFSDFSRTLFLKSAASFLAFFMIGI